MLTMPSICSVLFLFIHAWTLLYFSLSVKKSGVLNLIKAAEQRLHHVDEDKDMITEIHRRYLKNYRRP